MPVPERWDEEKEQLRHPVYSRPQSWIYVRAKYICPRISNFDRPRSLAVEQGVVNLQPKSSWLPRRGPYGCNTALSFGWSRLDIHTILDNGIRQYGRLKDDANHISAKQVVAVS